MPILEDEEVAKLIMESRFPAADAKDAALYRSMRKKGFICTIELDFADPAKEAVPRTSSASTAGGASMPASA